MIKDSFDQDKAESEWISRFEEAKATLHGSGAVEMLTRVAEVVPALELKVGDDVEYEGREVSPSVELFLPEKAENEIEGTRTGKRMSIWVYTLTPKWVSIRITHTSTIQSMEGGQIRPVTSSLMDNRDNDISAPGNLAKTVYNGLENYLKLGKEDLYKVGQALNDIPAKPTSSAQQ